VESAADLRREGGAGASLEARHLSSVFLARGVPAFPRHASWGERTIWARLPMAKLPIWFAMPIHSDDMNAAEKLKKLDAPSD
jgi:hypothetical protein